MSIWNSEEDDAREEYEEGQKQGSQAGWFERMVGPGIVSDEFQKGWENGHDNPAKGSDGHGD